MKVKVLKTLNLRQTQHKSALHHARAHDGLKINSGSHPEDRILEKESILMILPSTSMERKEGAQGCQEAGQNTEIHIRRQRSPFTVKIAKNR